MPTGKSDVNLICSFVSNLCFSLVVFKIVFLFLLFSFLPFLLPSLPPPFFLPFLLLVFCCIITIYLSSLVFLFIYSARDSLGFLNLKISVSVNSWKFLVNISLNIALFYSFSIISCTLIRYMLDILTIVSISSFPNIFNSKYLFIS